MVDTEIKLAEPPGYPGIPPRWTSSAKIGVGTAMSSDSNVWFTISHGIINEVYYPRLDVANIRDLGLLVTDGQEFFSEEKRDAEHEYELLEDGIPAYRVINTCVDQRYRIQKLIYCDPRKNVLLQDIEFIPLVGQLEDYHVYALLAPHILNAGWHNSCRAGEYKGHPMFFSRRKHVSLSLAFACDHPFLNMSCGYVGFSDGWQDISVHKCMTQFHPEAQDGNVAMCGEIDLKACGGKFTLALGFGMRAEAAGFQVKSSLLRDKKHILEEYIQQWRSVQKPCQDLACPEDAHSSKLFRMSTMVLKVHAGKHYSGSLIASLSIPWGFEKSDNDLGGYHLIWPRDQVLTAFAYMAAREYETARQVLHFLMITQEKRGYWPQCMWEDGSIYWKGMQLDETALPILLADRLRQDQQLDCINPYPMVCQAASFIIKHGPITEQDRWEEASGYTPATLAVEIAALLAAADFFEENDKKSEANYLRDMADWWNESIDRWLYVRETTLAKELNIKGYYVRVCPCIESRDGVPSEKQILINNRPAGENYYSYTDIVSVDALALVRYGLRAANDPRILNTVQAIDKLLRTETVRGPVWHRYNEDGYGEKLDGSPFDGVGIGRGWPLLTGERAHYEIAKGNRAEAIRLCRVFAEFAGVGGLFPEQVWDSADIPHKRLYNGHSTGSAKPLVWAHGEYITLLRSINDNQIYSTPKQTKERYLKNKHPAKYAFWAKHQQLQLLPHGKKLRIQLENAALIHWTGDDWKTAHRAETLSNALGIHYVDLSTGSMHEGQAITFTIFWKEEQRWEGVDYKVTCEGKRS